MKLPHILGSNMVLQRDTPLPIWGWAEAGEVVTVGLGRHEVSATADMHGKWMVRLPAMKPDGIHQMTVSGNNTIRLTDILIGEVWICSGQSNMEMGLGVVQNGGQEVAAANHPNIRLYHVPRTTAGQPAPDVNATWRLCSPENISAGRWGGFSAVAYFFGRELHKELGVPVGLINASWGGTRIEPWTPAEGFPLVPKLRDIAAEIDRANRDYRMRLPASLDAIASWIGATRQALADGETQLPPPPKWPRHSLDSSGRPTGLYNGMVHPLVPFAIRGAIWYQGEANVGSADGMMYHEKMKALIGGWRKVWGQGNFPFYYVQLAPFDYQLHRREYSPYWLPEIWEAQTASLSIPNTGMVVTTDISNLQDIHPGNKLDVGKRLALWSLAKTYGREGIVYSGPLYKSMSVEDGKIRIRFDHVSNGLASRDGKPLNWFEIAGQDKKFAEARAQIDGDTVVVWSETVTDPVAVRFGWHQEAEPNLMNKEELPASPFRTDPW
ncbi:MAG: sialate O-acetylesterase [Phycisphaerae bacterium]